MRHIRTIAWISVISILAVVAPTAQGPEPAQPWTFAVMADTQWIGTDDGENPGSSSVAIIRALNGEFVARGVKFVVQAGDLVDSTGSTVASVRNAEGVRAAFAQELYNAGIGFFPVRGNHDSNNLAGYEFRNLYPQTQGGPMNATPLYVFDGTTVVNPDAGRQPFPVRDASRGQFTLGSHFSSPDPATSGGKNWTGLSYAFDYQNARFVLLDQFTPLQADPASALSHNPEADAIKLQQPWIDGVLASKGAERHAFVFSHKGLIDENHVDALFGASPTADPASQDHFITTLSNAGVRYYMQGHDHMHDRSLVSVTTGSPIDPGVAKVQNILCASDSSKFYTPNIPANDVKYDVPAFGHARQAQVAQELHTIGYYLVTVDGPRVTVDYYSADLTGYVEPAGCSGAGCEWLISTTPALTFVKAESFGYSLNGREFLVAPAGSADFGTLGSSYRVVRDAFEGTTARIVGGVNGSTAADFDGRSFVKTIDTGWTDLADIRLASRVLTLWGTGELYRPHADTFALSLSYDRTKVMPRHLGNGGFGIAAKDADGRWVNAVDLNAGGAKRFVVGPWKASYGLGTYGVDPSTHTAWAVVDYSGDFAVARDIEPVPGHRK